MAHRWMMILLSVLWGIGSHGIVAAQDNVLILYDARVTLDLERHGLVVEGTLLVPSSVDSFRLHRNLRLDPMGWTEKEGGAGPQPRDDGGDYLTYYFPYWLHNQQGQYDQMRYFYRYEGEFYESAEGVTFSRENVGREIQATISEEGVYLASSAYWLPTVDGAMATYQLSIETPAGFEPVTQGVRTSQSDQDGRLTTTWSAALPSDGINLIAGRYHIQQDQAGATPIFTYFLQEDSRLSDLYLERTKYYIQMYEDMIGPYPYGKFATVENWFPTGYGMPSYTLLGSMVLRLPFIPYTSFGHEICHSWWGNAVFVGEGGNWCEGLTIYCADYHYQELESVAAAREYRRNLLKDYAAYVHDDKDFPLVDFQSRHSGATRAVGYGKSMMVFHLIDRMIGHEAFARGLQGIYTEHKYQRASWDDFLEVFAEAGGRDLSFVREQWLARGGAPSLSLVDAQRTDDGVRIVLAQEAPIYDLEIPIVVTTATEAVQETVFLGSAQDEFVIAADGARGVAVDPDYHLFRHLFPGEIEPTIRQVLGEDEPVFFLPASPDEAVEAAHRFAREYSESDAPTIMGGEALPATSAILINPAADVLERRLPRAATVAGDLVFLDGKRYSLQEYDFVLAAGRDERAVDAGPSGDPERTEVTDLIVLCRSPQRLPGLASRIGHYGKYSWLLLPAGRGETIKGNWKIQGSPLAREFQP
jgi:aminopeptidase N